MDYAQRLRGKHPIASGVTEAACGLIIKDRMCNRDMRWGLRTAQHIITLRSLIKTTGDCWQNFWKLAFNKPVAWQNKNMLPGAHSGDRSRSARRRVHPP